MLDHYQPDVAVMKLHILSDVHTEFSEFDPPETDADVVVLACDYKIHGTRVVCNPRGYPTESSHRGFQPELVVEL